MYWGRHVGPRRRGSGTEPTGRSLRKGRPRARIPIGGRSQGNPLSTDNWIGGKDVADGDGFQLTGAAVLTETLQPEYRTGGAVKRDTGGTSSPLLAG